MPQTPHILHIDDNKDDRDLFARAFAKSGLHGVLHSVPSSEDALRYLNRLAPYANAVRPRLIVLDLSLTQMDGRFLLALLRSHLSFKFIPVAILTASESNADLLRCRELGVEDYVVKPPTLEELVEVVASFGHWLAGSSSGISTLT